MGDALDIRSRRPMGVGLSVGIWSRVGSKIKVTKPLASNRIEFPARGYINGGVVPTIIFQSSINVNVGADEENVAMDSGRAVQHSHCLNTNNTLRTALIKMTLLSPSYRPRGNP